MVASARPMVRAEQVFLYYLTTVAFSPTEQNRLFSGLSLSHHKNAFIFLQIISRAYICMVWFSESLVWPVPGIVGKINYHNTYLENRLAIITKSLLRPYFFSTIHSFYHISVINSILLFFLCAVILSCYRHALSAPVFLFIHYLFIYVMCMYFQSPLTNTSRRQLSTPRLVLHNFALLRSSLKKMLFTFSDIKNCLTT